MKIPVIALDMIPGNIFSTKRYESENLEVRKLKIRTGRMYIQEIKSLADTIYYD
jgi:hypothetical protein